jgi:hypothetical protein
MEHKLLIKPDTKDSGLGTSAPSSKPDGLGCACSFTPRRSDQRLSYHHLLDMFLITAAAPCSTCVCDIFMTARNHTLHDLWHSQAVTNSGIMTKLWKTANVIGAQTRLGGIMILSIFPLSLGFERQVAVLLGRREMARRMGTRIHRCVALH